MLNMDNLKWTQIETLQKISFFLLGLLGLAGLMFWAI